MPSLLSLPVLRSADTALRFLPGSIATPLARVGGRAYGRFSPDERRVVEANLRRVRPGLTGAALARLVDEVFDGYGRYWADAMRLPHLDRAAIADGFTVEGLERVTDALAAGQSPIVALPHLGGWEWAGAWMVQVAGFELTAVAERLDPPEVFEWFVEYRRRLGMEIIPLGPDAGARLASAMTTSRVVTLLCDRDIAGDGVEVDFFGEPTRLPGGPALLALRNGAPLLPTAVYFDGPRCKGVVGEALDTERRGRLRADVTRVTQDLAHALEDLIRVAPGQWHLLQPSWPADYELVGRHPPGTAAGPTGASS